MTETQRIGQLFAVGLADDHLSPDTVSAIQAYHFGSVHFIVTTSVGVAGIRAVTSAVQSLASPDTTGGVRFFIAANQEGGEIQALQGAGFSRMPSALDQGSLPTARLDGLATRWGRELADAGVNVDFAPVMDVVPPGTDGENRPIGALDREFGHDPATVAAHGVAFLRGMERAGIIPTAKHFPGLGRVQGNTDFAAGVTDSVTTANDPYLATFREAIDSGIPFVMVALATYTRIDPTNMAVFSPVVIRELLHGTMHFEGVVVSDDLGSSVQVANIPPGERAERFLEAGGDLIVSKTVPTAIEMYGPVLARAQSDESFRRLVDHAALRILRAKEATGLLPCTD